MCFSRFRIVVLSAVVSCAYPVAAQADSIVLGFNTQTPLQMYSLSGAYQGDFGPAGASTGIEENGLMYVVQPDISGTTSTVTALDATQSDVSSFTFPDLIADGAPGPNGTLWLAGYDGTVYNVSTTGQILSSFTTGYSDIGIASNGNTLYTTEGDTGDGIDVRGADGTVLSTINTGISSIYGIGYEASDSGLYVGSFDFVYQFDSSGDLLNTMNIPGDSRTPNGAVHDGLEIADLSQLITVGTGTPSPVPEPGTFLLIAPLAGIALLVVNRRKVRRLACLFLLAAFLPAAFASVSVNITPSATMVPVGTPISFTATASDSSDSSATFTYQYNVKAPGSTSFTLLKDYYYTNTFTWAPTAHEGSYSIEVNVKSSNGDTGSSTEPITVTSRVTGSAPVVSPTQHPLVALYSAPPCTAPKQVRVRFKGPSAVTWQATPFQTCDGYSVNFLIAGMTANTTYSLQQDLYNGPFDTPGPVLSFTTGSIPGNISFPSRSTLIGPASPTNLSYPFIVEMPTFYPFGTDLNGNIVWYLTAYSPTVNPHESGTLLRNTSSGTFLGVQDDPNVHCPGSSNYCGNNEFLREFDLAGNIVRETNWTILNQEVNTLRASEGKSAVHLTDISHEAFRLPTGYTAIIIADQEIKNQGQGDVLVDGDGALVVDQNFHPIWFWDSFDYLNILRKALMDETCAVGQAGCATPRQINPSTGQYFTIANDWTHCNSLTLDPIDGNLILSSRNQAQVYKLDYKNATGDGHIIWTLGVGGTFTLPSNVPQSAWFDYQHDVERWPNGTLTLFDNNNEGFGGLDSRGQAWSLNETTLVATPLFNVDLGSYSLAVGYATVLSNGNYDFGSGFIDGGQVWQTQEYTPSGTQVYSQKVTGASSYSYRPMRLPDFYTQR